jgi:hypothetical protein
MSDIDEATEIEEELRQLFEDSSDREESAGTEHYDILDNSLISRETDFICY